MRITARFILIYFRIQCDYLQVTQAEPLRRVIILQGIRRAGRCGGLLLPWAFSRAPGLSQRARAAVWACSRVLALAAPLAAFPPLEPVWQVKWFLFTRLLQRGQIIAGQFSESNTLRIVTMPFSAMASRSFIATLAASSMLQTVLRNRVSRTETV